MTTWIIEFYYGPLDGLIREVPFPSPEVYRIPLAPLATTRVTAATGERIRQSTADYERLPGRNDAGRVCYRYMP